LFVRHGLDVQFREDATHALLEHMDAAEITEDEQSHADKNTPPELFFIELVIVSVLASA